MRQLSLRDVHASLGRTTEWLATELASPKSAPPDWCRDDWRIARAVAAMHGIAPLLARRLAWVGPPDWAQFLQNQYAETAARYTRLRDLADAIDARARGAGIAIVGLKGLALHARGLYEAGERPMADLDLLVSPIEVSEAIKLIEELGFRKTHVTWKHAVFEPQQKAPPAAFGESARNALKIELHTHLGEQLPLHPVELDAAVFPRIPRPGLNDYRSSATLMAHLLLHAAGVMVLKELRLLHLHDIAQLAAAMQRCDWSEFLDGDRWWAHPPLALAARYFPVIPLEVLEALAERCPRRLRRIQRRRRLADVSFSRLWVDAFPGLDWSRTLPEALSYIARRLAPSPETLALRKTLLSSQVGLRSSSWARMPQAQRALRFAVSRPPRPCSLHNVRHVLEQP
jgi:hypothetical protein